MRNRKISLVIPCYNEEKNIPLFYKECMKAYSNSKYQFELVFVNDGSKDNTIKELKKLIKEKTFTIKIINFSRNFGKEAGMYAGLKNTTGDYVAIIDADLQQKPELILPMIEKLEENEEYDCVCYYQEKRIEGGIISFFKKTFYKTIEKLSEIKFVNGASDFRLFRRYVVDAILSLPEKNRFSKGIFSWIGFNTCYLPYIPEERANGKSNFNFKGLVKYALSGILSFSVAPLRLATYSGLLFSLLSFIYLIIVIIQKLVFTIDVPGYATLIACILLIGGLILFGLGIIGEYIARIYMEVKDRPIYITKEILSNKGATKDEKK